MREGVTENSLRTFTVGLGLKPQRDQHSKKAQTVLTHPRQIHQTVPDHKAHHTNGVRLNDSLKDNWHQDREHP